MQIQALNKLLAAICYHPDQVHSIDAFLSLSPKEQGIGYEWLIAQELLRRAAILNADILSPLAFWQSKDHEIDFYVPPHSWFEVKRGESVALDFSWFIRQFPKQNLTVINPAIFETAHVRGITFEEFLLG